MRSGDFSEFLGQDWRQGGEIGLGADQGIRSAYQV